MGSGWMDGWKDGQGAFFCPHSLHAGEDDSYMETLLGGCRPEQERYASQSAAAQLILEIHQPCLNIQNAVTFKGI